jgi:demethylmenaquinone methyltransferase/2-methoxy-6-polyprenyl-1,4-benzoquinol methylase
MSGKLSVPATAFHASFNCLWCGRPHRTRGDEDLEGWAMLCPDCVGRAQDNEFLRFRLRDGLKRRAAATSRHAPVGAQLDANGEGPGATRETDETGPDETDETLRRYYAARAPEYDNWYLRRGRYSHGVIADAAWNAELDAATQWLDALPISGEIVELAAGTGWWSPLLASKGQLSLYDAVEEPLDRARDRLLAHGLAAHIHVRDAWAPPDRQVDALFCGFWLSHVERQRLNDFLAICRAWLKPGGLFCFIDSRRDPQSSATNHPTPANDQSLRRLDDGREFTITKVYYEPAELEDALRSAGFAETKVETTPRFFLLGRASAAG